MENRTLIVTRKQSAFARHAQLLGLNVVEMGRPSACLEQCAAIYWDILTMGDFIIRNKVKTLLLRAPKGCIRILDFNVREVTDSGLVKESLALCDILKIEKQTLLAVCRLLGIVTQDLFDSSFDLMAAFGIRTLILNHGDLGSHVLQDGIISEKWGYFSFDNCSVEEAQGAFTAAFFAASLGEERLFTECHRKAFNYLESMSRKRKT